MFPGMGRIGMTSLISFLTFRAALTLMVNEQQSTTGSCLLQKHNKATIATFDQVHQWRLHHMSLVGVVNKSKSLLDKFIDAQTASKSACSSRLMESKRVLDGLLKDVASLNSQVMSREEIVETETENLAISKMSLEAVKTEYYKSMRHCKQQRKEAIEDYKKYAQELNELNQIAMPSERYNHAVFVRSNDTHTKVFQGERLQTRESLLQFSFDKKMCLAFVKFAKRHSDVLGDTPPKEGGKACDEQREELQKAFYQSICCSEPAQARRKGARSG